MKITQVELIPLSVAQLNPDDCDGQYNDFRFGLPTRPGIGVELNEETVRKYRMAWKS